MENKNSNHLEPTDSSNRDFASPNGEWFGTASEGKLWFWRTDEADDMYTPTFEAKDLADANKQIDEEC